MNTKFETLLKLLDIDNNLIIKHVLDIDLDMFISVSNDNTKYYINFNKKYRYAKLFSSVKEAEDYMIAFADDYNDYENQLRNLC